MGHWGPSENSAEPRFYEVYGSSSRLSFSRYFIVAHVDGFIYVLDKYFCISRLVPARIKLQNPANAVCTPQQPQGANANSRSHGDLRQYEALRAAGEADGRQQAHADQGSGVEGREFLLNDGCQSDAARNVFVPVRIADVFSVLYRNDKRVFSQLLTGNHQYDQRHLQALRQKSLLLSNRRDGCLYLFLKQFLVRISLRGTVTVVADLLQLALTAASSLRSNVPSGVTSGVSTAGPPHAQLGAEEEAGGGPRSSSPIRYVISLPLFCKEMGYEDKGAFLNEVAEILPCAQFSSFSGVKTHAAPTAESPASTAARKQISHKLGMFREQLHARGQPLSSREGSNSKERFQEFVASRGEHWEVNNCCLDGEGRCFYTMAYTKALSPLQQRGMVFCLDTQNPVRARALQFGRGVAGDAVLSLSLAAHPIAGCFLVVAKSASAVRRSLLSPLASVFVSAGSCPALGSSGEEGKKVQSAAFPAAAAFDRNESVYTPEVQQAAACIAKAPTSESSATQQTGTPGGPSATLKRQEEKMSLQSTKEDSQTRLSDRMPNALARFDTEGETEDNNTACPSPLEQPQPISVRGDAAEVSLVSTNLLDPVSGWPAAGQEASIQNTTSHTAENVGSDLTPGAHSTWWFYPSEEDPSFYFPVAECLDDEAIHLVAQSVCRQLRGSSSTSVCRAYFGDDSSAAVREAAAAATAARKAELLILAAAEAAATQEGDVSPLSRSATSAGDSVKANIPVEQTLFKAAAQALNEAALAAARAEAAPSSGYILWQPGIKVKRPKTGEEAINFGAAILIRARTTERPNKTQKTNNSASGMLPYCMRPPRALEFITGETIADIGQDARHLEVRDVLPSPLGFIVVPAEAANRIVTQRPGGSPARLASRNSLSLSSFLSVFVAGSVPSLHSRADVGATSPNGSAAAGEEGRQPPADAAGTSTDTVSAAASNTNAAFSNPTADAFPQKAIPAVNIVFLVDTLRVCRFAKATSPAVCTPQSPGPSWDASQSETLAKRNQLFLGLSESAPARGAAAWPLFEGYGSSSKTTTGNKPSFIPFGDGRMNSGSQNVKSAAGKAPRGRRCACSTAYNNFEASRAPALHSQFADVLLLCADGFELPSHRALLAARSSFFEAKLTRSHWEAQGQGPDNMMIDLREFSGSVVQATVRFFESGSFCIPAACCCSVCCMETRRYQKEQQQAAMLQSSRIRSHEALCCCRVDWVLQAYTFAAYCLLQDLQAELLSVLARLISQRTCLHVLTHPAIRNQQQILQLAAHQLVYHLPMPHLLLEADDGLRGDLGSDSTEDNSSQNPSECTQQKVPQPDDEEEETVRGGTAERMPLLRLLLSEGIYEVIVAALSSWVLDTRENILFFSTMQLIRSAHPAPSNLRSRQLLLLLALRLLQESIISPSSCLVKRLDSLNLSPKQGSKNPSSSSWESKKSPFAAPAAVNNAMHLLSPKLENTSLLVRLCDSRDIVRYFMFRDVLLLWAKVLQVPEQEAKVIAEGAEDLGFSVLSAPR